MRQLISFILMALALFGCSQAAGWTVSEGWERSGELYDTGHVTKPEIPKEGK